MSIRTINGWHIDDNNNRWNAAVYTAAEAAQYSQSLTNCTGCEDCKGCKYCTECKWCTGCEVCTGCTECKWCTGCEDGKDCTGCKYCRGCTECKWCTGCEDGKDCTGCKYCRGCKWCKDCTGCKYCRGCHDFAVNPQRITGWEMGSRNDNPTVYWLEPSKEQCVVGCFRGTLDELETRVKETHKNNPEYLNNYLKFIKNVRAYQEICREGSER